MTGEVIDLPRSRPELGFLRISVGADGSFVWQASIPSDDVADELCNTIEQLLATVRAGARHD